MLLAMMRYMMNTKGHITGNDSLLECVLWFKCVKLLQSHYFLLQPAVRSLRWKKTE